MNLVQSIVYIAEKAFVDMANGVPGQIIFGKEEGFQTLAEEQPRSDTPGHSLSKADFAEYVRLRNNCVASPNKCDLILGCIH